jgi:hypothetical protein
MTINATIPEEINYYQTSGDAIKGLSYSLKPTDDFANCQCDLTVGGCDEACCCDPDCDKKILKLW